MFQRNMISGSCGLLFYLAVVGNVPPKYRFSVDKAPEDLLLSRMLVPSAFEVLLSKVHFLQIGLRINIDDMACVYLTDDRFSFGNTTGIVLKDSVPQSKHFYSNHFKAPESSAKQFWGVKG